MHIQGIFPPIPTPFDVEGNIAHHALSENLEHWNHYDLSGYVVLGSNGEAPYLTDKEKRQVLETARQRIPSDKLLIAGTGCESTRHTITLTQIAAQAGADAALVLTPHYYDTQMTESNLLAHYQKVADASPIPILLYNVPKFTHVDMAPTTVAQVARHPNIVSIKDSSGNIAKLADIVRLVKADFQVLAGSASFFLAGLMLGAVGGVLALANVAPQACLDIEALFKSGQWEQAAALQRHMLPVNAAITARFGIAGLKAALDLLGYYGGPVRAPLRDLSHEDRQQLGDILEAGMREE